MKKRAMNITVPQYIVDTFHKIICPHKGQNLIWIILHLTWKGTGTKTES